MSKKDGTFNARELRILQQFYFVGTGPLPSGAGTKARDSLKNRGLIYRSESIEDFSDPCYALTNEGSEAAADESAAGNIRDPSNSN